MKAGSLKRKAAATSALANPESTMEKDQQWESISLGDDSSQNSAVAKQTSTFVPRLLVRYVSIALLLIAAYSVANTYLDESQSMNTIQSQIAIDPTSGESFETNELVNPLVPGAAMSSNDFVAEQGSQDICPKTINSPHRFRTMEPPLSTAHDLDYILEGPALNMTKESPIYSYGACKFVETESSPHFPHAMQQLIRCISWWQYHRELQQTRSPAFPPLELILIWPKKAPKIAAMLHGVLSVLRGVWKVKIVPLRGNAPVVRAQVEMGYRKPRPNKLGFQTRKVSDIQEFRNDVVEWALVGRTKREQSWGFLPRPAEKQDVAIEPKQNPRILILNRESSSGRSIMNAQELKAALEWVLPISHIQLVSHFGEHSFREQVAEVATSDIVISPHGGQLTSIFLMPRCGAVVELFSKGYYVPEYFGSLAASSGIRHTYLYTGGDDMDSELDHYMKDLTTRTIARLFPVCAPLRIVVEHVVQEVRLWKERASDPMKRCP